MIDPDGSPAKVPDAFRSIRAPLSVALLEPRRPHDALPFDRLARSYNFRMTSDRRKVFTRVVIERLSARPAPRRGLDVGCGRGIGRRTDYVHAIRECVEDLELWGIEPDSQVRPDPAHFDRVLPTAMELADLPAESFDLAYSYMVMEHVERPAAFFGAVFECLKPGGEYLFVTPNKRHYFTRLAVLLHRLGLDEVVLRIVRPESGEYHYPVQYLCNSEEEVARYGKVGFEPPRFAYLEPTGPAGYLPGALRPVFWAATLKRAWIRNPRSLVTMMALLKKPETG